MLDDLNNPRIKETLMSTAEQLKRAAGPTPFVLDDLDNPRNQGNPDVHCRAAEA
ncbi:MAG TPA: hypothetical protein VK348_02025 [Planctomycetota bacterium]|nr:hypothetical protein [Planctomycetota bacterium]